MITKICSLTFSGVDITDVDVQVQISPGVPNFVIVGLADKTIAESTKDKGLLYHLLALPFRKKE